MYCSQYKTCCYNFIISMNIFIYFRIRVISIATQQFMANVTNGAMQRCKGRFATLTSKSGEVPKNGKYTLTMEDLTPALFDYGITIRKPPYFV